MVTWDTFRKTLFLASNCRTREAIAAGRVAVDGCRQFDFGQLPVFRHGCLRLRAALHPGGYIGIVLTTQRMILKTVVGLLERFRRRRVAEVDLVA